MFFSLSLSRRTLSFTIIGSWSDGLINSKNNGSKRRRCQAETLALGWQLRAELNKLEARKALRVVEE